MDIIERLDAAIKTEDFWVGDQREDNILKDSKKIIEQLRELEARYWKFAPKYDNLLDDFERLKKAMDVQGNAVKVLHQAETSELNYLRKTAQEAYAAKMTLDSEREANKILTDEIEQLRNNQSIIITSFRINMMRLCPDYSHEEFDKDIAVMLKEKK